MSNTQSTNSQRFSTPVHDDRLELPTPEQTGQNLFEERAVRMALDHMTMDTGEEEETKRYEHETGTVIATILKSVFREGCWALTAEKTDQVSNKRPDFTIEHASSQVKTLRPWLVCEIKKNGPGADRMEDVLTQVRESVHYTYASIKSEWGEMDRIYVIGVCGTRIGFFEFYTYEVQDDNFDGFVSLTQNLDGDESKFPVEDVTGVLPLFNTSTVLNGTKDKSKQDMRDRARSYRPKCIFNFEDPIHLRIIQKIFTHMATNPTRSAKMDDGDSQ